MSERYFVLRRRDEQTVSSAGCDQAAVIFAFDVAALPVQARRMGLVPAASSGLAVGYCGADGHRYMPDMARDDDAVAGAALTAFDWHGWGGSPLYQFTSWGGLIFSEGHRSGLVREIDQCLPSAEDDGERARLGTLRRFVVGAALCPEAT
jgi:hypothetical protein